LLQVLIASDRTLVRAGLAALAAAAEDCQVAGQTGLAEVEEQAASLRPDAILLDAVSDDPESLEPVRRLAASLPQLPILVVGGEAAPDQARRALEAGARGYLQWDAAGEELAAALRAAEQGLVVLSPAVARDLLGRTAPPTQPSDGEPLTPREREVLQLLAQGLPSKTISTRLHLSEHTVKFHVGSIMQKLGAASRTEAVTLAIRKGLVVL
jgi:DNA-binding NarL/FixJ family response regulator